MNMRAYYLISGVVAAAIIIGVASFFFMRDSGQSPDAAEAPDVAAVEPDVIPTVPETRPVSEDWRSYESAAFRFGLLYPQELEVLEYNERDGALSVIFEDPNDGRGFQIYVTPYAESQITRERFLLDAPSGVMEEPTDILVSGAQATMFFGKNSIMGETREVWFIHNGFLYEVATYKQLDSWLAEIMQTWKFL